MLRNPTDYGITNIKVIKLYDMYSPYKDEKLKTEYDEDEHINLSQLSCELRYDLSYPRTSCKRTHRYLVECDLGSKHYIFGQYFYYKTN